MKIHYSSPIILFSISVVIILLAPNTSYSRLSVPRKDMSLESIRVGDTILVDYEFVNTGWTEVKLVGALSSCSCSTVEDLPITISSKQSYTLKVRVKSPSYAGDFSGRITVLLDDSSLPSVVLTFKGRAI
ncbi:MAG: DUF1573 domain-containing protein [Planctomycetales bacterium]|nr:DUF1573 domain-containing protein [Planctomycetales bacterium]